MKFYEVKQGSQSLGFFRTRSLAEEYEKTFNTKVMVYPTNIVEHKFKTKKDIK